MAGHLNVCQRSAPVMAAHARRSSGKNQRGRSAMSEKIPIASSKPPEVPAVAMIPTSRSRSITLGSSALRVPSARERIAGSTGEGTGDADGPGASMEDVIVS
jgi:hypothetical protein